MRRIRFRNHRVGLSVLLVTMTYCTLNQLLPKDFELNLIYQSLNLPHFQLTTCPRFVTVLPGGRLGNIIWEYMSLVAVAKLYGDLQPLTPYGMKATLLELFEQIGADEISSIPDQCVTSANLQFLNLSDVVIPLNSSLLLARYSARYKDIIRYGTNNIKKQLRFKQKFIDRARNYLNRIKADYQEEETSNEGFTFVAIHYRGDDYVSTLEKYYSQFSEPPDYRYYQIAMNYFRARYQHPVFILVSVDTAWLADNIVYLSYKDVYVKPLGDELEGQYEDLVFLSMCNHSIINYGTFGATSALFAAGETLAYDLGLEEDQRGFTLVTSLTRLLPNWHLCNNTMCYVD